ncbi:single-stranded-DNA-specific exonuclease RecJ [Patescibacteria group bacterium]
MPVWKISSKYNEKESVTDQILKNRGIISEKERELFLNPPSFSHWFKKLPRDLLGSLRDARDLINETISKNIPIVVHGDYDADGICASAILYKTIKEDLGYENVCTFIPNRFEHGYGLSEKSIQASLDKVKENGGSEKVLFVTVDSGITANEEIEQIVKAGHKVIVTDHHQKPKELPPADIIVWYDQVVGATVAYLLSVVLGLKDKDLIAYSCVATITDLQPVLSFNRTIVKQGLEIINSNPPLGIKSLLGVSGRAGNIVTAGDLGWIVGPRLNASGRVEDPSLALDLLLENDSEASTKIARELNQVNSKRQDKTLEMYEIAAELDEEELPKIIVSYDENYHEGIIGLVASRLAKKYYRPAIVISTAEDISKGSVRSIQGINIIETLREVEDLFTSLGGHPMAAGFSIKREDIGKLEEFLREFSEKYISDEMLNRVLKVDLGIPASLIDENLMNELDLLRPYGMGNREPVFASYNLNVTGVNIVGKEQQHLSLRLLDGDKFAKAIYFNYKDYFKEEINTGNKIDIVYTLKKNEFNGKTYIDMIIKDIKKSEV